MLRAEQRPGPICQPTAGTVRSHAVLISPVMMASNSSFAHSYCATKTNHFSQIFMI